MKCEADTLQFKNEISPRKMKRILFFWRSMVIP